MTAFVLAPPGSDLPLTGMRLDIFPGSATPSVFPAGEPFWIGYGFVAEAESTERFDRDARFELDVDGEPLELLTQLEEHDGRTPTSKHSVANFEAGLPVGWHRFAGRWYSQGQLVLTSDRSVEFVES